MAQPVRQVVREDRRLANEVQRHKNTVCCFALSALFGVEMRDGGRPPLLPYEQAKDIENWRKTWVQK